ncbi:MAG TPA: hypothetical protein VFR91_09105 [Dyella sp.]|nr:hypothetical protein [Dyella sp.]
MSATTAIVVAMAAKRNRLIKQMIERGAVTEAAAIPSKEVPRVAQAALRELERQSAIKIVSGDRIYLDQSRLQEIYRGNRAALELFLLVLCGTAVLLGLAACSSHAA